MLVQLSPPPKSSEATHVVPAAPSCNTHATLKQGDASTINSSCSAHIRVSPEPTFHNHYYCDRCPLEWDEYALFEGPAWCPCCDEAVEPYDSIDIREDAA